MLKFDEVIERVGIKKTELAQKLGIESTNINRTLRKFEKNLSEIDSFLALLGTSLKQEVSGEIAVSKIDNTDLLKTLKIQAELLASQQGVIKEQQETIKTFTTQLQKRTA